MPKQVSATLGGGEQFSGGCWKIVLREGKPWNWVGDAAPREKDTSEWLNAQGTCQLEAMGANEDNKPYHLEQYLSNFSVRKAHLQNLSKHRFLGPTHRILIQ